MRKPMIYLATVCLGLFASPTLAQTASSSGFALSANETVTAPGVANVNVAVGPLAATSGSAPPNYNVSNSVASLNQSAVLTGGLAGTTERLQTGLLTSNSTGTATGASATATVNNLSTGIGLTALNDLALASIFRFGATTIQSQSTASSIGGLSASGATTIEGLTLGGSALQNFEFNAALFSNPAPNTVLFDFGGLSIILNQQIRNGDGLNSLGITTNAINVGFNNFVAGTGLANGNIIIGQTRAGVTAGVAAVPEPATWAMMLIGFGAMGVSMRRRKSKVGAMQLA
jgi:PEP-CTERM motif